MALSMLTALAVPALGVTPLSTWTQGIATNYGGAQDGLQPDQPSFGTKDVSLPLHYLVLVLAVRHACAHLLT